MSVKVPTCISSTPRLWFQRLIQVTIQRNRESCVILALSTGNPTETGPRFNIKMSSSQYRKTLGGDKTVVRSSYIHYGVSYTGKIIFFYWISPRQLSAQRKSKQSESESWRHLALTDMVFFAKIFTNPLRILSINWGKRYQSSVTNSLNFNWNRRGCVHFADVVTLLSLKMKMHLRNHRVHTWIQSSSQLCRCSFVKY